MKQKETEEKLVLGRHKYRNRYLTTYTLYIQLYNIYVYVCFPGEYADATNAGKLMTRPLWYLG